MVQLFVRLKFNVSRVEVVRLARSSTPLAFTSVRQDAESFNISFAMQIGIGAFILLHRNVLSAWRALAMIVAHAKS